ncbi:MAG: 50S ribosomal protein L9 [Candidatus Harrisonbacteria bacterium RIFCSPHIGHO2_12_FULL_48_16]|uniref:Large ribosomal subunit protein bL9 n=3 Tax=Parcubacteria group TaxID=1794811 RepID=A0A1G2FX06_9BACT|nr:MAG: 50S ribosomal protein L9 [Candidatus Harrisonbacteria bacterium RIFCSPHIGHO2_12_FULL_48_16]OGZ42603.1 MAG: 50S ribosomal protein L9 [Candidatus Ryanbacteria bacterium RIFCSPHIGHO2_01_45_13]
MKVLLLENVKKIGRKNEIKEVSDGYARNFLIPNKKAMPANQTALHLKNNAETKENTLLARYKELAEKLNGETLVFELKTGLNGEVFGSINAEQIEKTLKEKGYGETEVSANSLKTLGEHQATVRLGRGINGTVKVRLLSRS